MTVVRKIACDMTSVVDRGERAYTVESRPSAEVHRFRPGQSLRLALTERWLGRGAPAGRMRTDAWE
jgi:hypothetical protein